MEFNNISGENLIKRSRVLQQLLQNRLFVIEVKIFLF